MNPTHSAHTPSSRRAHESLPAMTSETWTPNGQGIERLAHSVAARFAKTPAEREELFQIVLLSLFDTVDGYDARTGLDIGQLAMARMMRDIRSYRADRFLAQLRNPALAFPAPGARSSPACLDAGAPAPARTRSFGSH